MAPRLRERAYGMVYLHDCCLISTSVAVIRCAEKSHNSTLVRPIIPFHHELRKSRTSVSCTCDHRSGANNQAPPSQTAQQWEGLSRLASEEHSRVTDYTLLSQVGLRTHINCKTGSARQSCSRNYTALSQVETHSVHPSQAATQGENQSPVRYIRS